MDTSSNVKLSKGIFSFWVSDFISSQMNSLNFQKWQVRKWKMASTETVVQRCSIKKCSQKFRKIHSKTPVPESQVFSCEIFKIPKSAFFTEHLRTTASASTKVTTLRWKHSKWPLQTLECNYWLIRACWKIVNINATLTWL